MIDGDRRAMALERKETTERGELAPNRGQIDELHDGDNRSMTE